MPSAHRNRKFLTILLSVIVGTVVLFYIGRYVLYTEIRKAIARELTDLSEKGINIQYDHIDVKPFSGKIQFYNLRAQLGTDTISGLTCVIPHLLIKGIKILPYLEDKTLSIGSIDLHDAVINYTSGSKLIEEDTSSKKKIVLRNIMVNEIKLPGIRLCLKDTLGKDTVVYLHGQLAIHGLGLERHQDSLTWQEAEIQFQDINLRFPKEYYGATIKNFRIALAEKSITLDSAIIKPFYSRKLFMKKNGREIDYIAGVVPYVDLKDVNWYTYPSLSVDIESIKLQFFLRVFRDKRYPFIKDKNTILPSHFLQQLPIQLMIDTIQLKESYVSYEEFPAQGDSSGAVVFDQLHATIIKVHNNPELKEPILMQAYSRFMNTGDLHVSFSFPYDVSKPYTVSGSLQKFPLNGLNSMVGAAAKLKIESGVMTNLKFDYRYTMLNSTGMIELNYEDLKISSLREDKDGNQAISPIKTLLLNAFIKKDMNKDVNADKRTGEISFYRDTKRSIFNYWWKSVFSGLKAAYNLDKLPSKKEVSARKAAKKKRKEMRTAMR
ncbi:MAG TPA: hypothetical protein VD884_09355 [Ohtaekwangia sp.]|nr:hypothetical protein [Ohtaekwangia sp.]